MAKGLTVQDRRDLVRNTEAECNDQAQAKLECEVERLRQEYRARHPGNFEHHSNFQQELDEMRTKLESANSAIENLRVELEQTKALQAEQAKREEDFQQRELRYRATIKTLTLAAEWLLRRLDNVDR